MYKFKIINNIQVGDSLIVFGGSGGYQSFNDIHRFQIEKSKWTKLEPCGQIPNAREGHIAKIIGNDKMIIHGGVDQSETSFDDTYILVGLSIVLGISTSYNRSLLGGSSVSLSSNAQGSESRRTSGGTGFNGDQTPSG